MPFAAVADEARLWVFGAARPLDGPEADRLRRAAEDFVAGWLAHGYAVTGASELRENHFLLVAADERASEVSGCSIDALFRALAQVERELGITLLDPTLVWHRDADGVVRATHRPEFRRLVEGGLVQPDTLVFDNTVATVGALRAGDWERPFRDSWHARAFRPRAAAGG